MKIRENCSEKKGHEPFSCVRALYKIRRDMFSILAMTPLEFPEDFQFGAAAAGYQIEGNCTNSNFYLMEQEHPEKLPERSGSSCNFWELYRNDIELFGKLGWQVFRTSLEWSRLEPEHGVHDEAAMSRYLDMLERLAAQGIKVSLTLHHWSHPLWFEKLGGFGKRENIRYFLEFIDYLVPRVKDYVDTWNIMNEFTNYGASRDGFEMMKNLTVAHAYGYHAVKQYSDRPVSSTHAMLPLFPRNPGSRLDAVAAALRDWSTNEYLIHAFTTGEMLLPYMDGEFIPELKDSFDYWAITYYTRHFASAKKADLTAGRRPYNQVRMIDYEFYVEESYPDGFVEQLPRYSGKPIYICENGVCADDDRLRIVYLAKHLWALHEARQNGCDIRSYMHWSALDNYEWGSFKPRFGLIGVDFATQERTVKPSALFYRDVIRNHGITSEMIEKWIRPLCDFQTYPIR